MLGLAGMAAPPARRHDGFTLGRPPALDIARTRDSLTAQQVLAGHPVTRSCRHCPGERPWCLVNDVGIHARAQPPGLLSVEVAQSRSIEYVRCASVYATLGSTKAGGFTMISVTAVSALAPRR
jgi:hypothetical protein